VVNRRCGFEMVTSIDKIKSENLSLPRKCLSLFYTIIHSFRSYFSTLFHIIQSGAPSPYKLIVLNTKIEWLYFKERIHNPVTYNTFGRTYQSFKMIESGLSYCNRIGLDGEPETAEKRVDEIYRISGLLKPNMKALDIGANACFISVYLAKKVNSVVALEPNTHLLQVGKTTSDFLRINNVEFLDILFEDYHRKNNNKLKI